MEEGKRERYCISESQLEGERGKKSLTYLLPNLKVTGIVYFHFKPKCCYARIASSRVA